MIKGHWHYPKLEIDRKRYFEPFTVTTALAALAAAGGTAGVGAGIGNMFGLFGNDNKNSNEIQWREPKWYQNPEYPEAGGARQNWAKTLTDWQGSGTYGANLPNFESIFENAKKRISQYYWGSPTGGGVIDKIRASAARRGVQDSPAADVLTSRMGAEEASKLGDISVGVDTQKAGAIEQARTNWLSSLMSLSQQKPSGTWSTGQSFQQPYQTGLSDVLSTLGTGAFQLASNMPSYMTNPYGSDFGDLTGGISSPYSDLTSLLGGR